MACNVILNLILARKIGIQGIAVATSLASILFLTLLTVCFERRLVWPLGRFLAVLLCGALALGFGLAKLVEKVDSAALRILLILILGSGGWLAWLWLFSESRSILRTAIESVRGRFSR